jgi:hypothetical protein
MSTAKGVRREGARAGASWRGLVVVVLMAFGGHARADILVFDACVVRCDEADLQAISNVRLALREQPNSGYVIAAPDDVRERLGGGVPQPANQDPHFTPDKLEKHLKDGIAKWAATPITDLRENEEAARLLVTALLEAKVNPAIVVADPSMRQLVQRAYVAWALSLYRLKRVEDAKRAIGDLVRATPEASILDLWGTDADKVFQLARKDLVAHGTGSLTIQVDDPEVAFYLNATGQPHRGVFAADAMLPGTYQVFMTDPAKRSRRYYVTVSPRGHAVLKVDWRRDAAFELPTAERRRVGFTFTSLADRRNEAAYAGQLASLVPGALAVVVGRIKWDGKDATIGAMYSPDDATPYQVGVAPGIDMPAARELATFLMYPSMPAPHVIALAAPPWADTVPVASARNSAMPQSAKWLFVGGLTAIAIGATLYAIDQSPDRQTAPYGLAVGAVGVASLSVGAGIWLLARPGRAGAVTAAATSGDVMVGWLGRF